MCNLLTPVLSAHDLVLMTKEIKKGRILNDSLLKVPQLTSTVKIFYREGNNYPTWLWLVCNLEANSFGAESMLVASRVEDRRYQEDRRCQPESGPTLTTELATQISPET